MILVSFFSRISRVVMYLSEVENWPYQMAKDDQRRRRRDRSVNIQSFHQITKSCLILPFLIFSISYIIFAVKCLLSCRILYFNYSSDTLL